MRRRGPDAEGRRPDGLFGKLSDGGTVLEPMTHMLSGDYRGALVDMFRVRWMVDVEGTAG